MKPKIIGIDEVGRGPVAGPVAVCAFSMPSDLDDSCFGELKDSKKLSAKKRQKIYEQVYDMKKKEVLDFSVCFSEATEIDEKGISFCIKKCLNSCLKGLKAKPEDCLILLDGGLYAPEIFEQKTIIRGDEKERPIALASIVAKVTRDNLMKELSYKYSEYGFEKHKGYGTKAHMESIKKYGMCIEHRRTFLQ